MTCPLCHERRARRTCPALGESICSVCCGTKRLVEIPCPADCPYLTSSREHPAAALLRQQQRDISVLVQLLRDFNTRQADLFTGVAASLQRYEPLDLQPLIDDDVADAAGALADTYETAARGLIYEHRPRSLPADRLATTLKPLVDEAGKHGGSAFDRDAAVVLRRLELAVREQQAAEPSNRRAFLELLRRVLNKPAERTAAEEEPAERPRLIVP